MTSQIRRATFSVHLYIAERTSRKSVTDRKRYDGIARGCIIEIDAVLYVRNDLTYLTNDTNNNTCRNNDKMFQDADRHDTIKSLLAKRNSTSKFSPLTIHHLQ